MQKKNNKDVPSDCVKDMLPIRDAIEVISGKWKLMILVSVKHGNHRFREIERSIPKISSKVLSKELKDLEQHGLVKRIVYEDYPVLIEYTLTDYAKTLGSVMNELHKWGVLHRKKMIGR